MKLFFSILIICTFSCCKQESIILTEKTLLIDLKALQDTLEMSKVIDSICYIPLETNDDFLIGRVDKLLVTDDNIFILDRKLTRSVFCFDRKGGKKFKINRIGRGPGEYINIIDISYNLKSRELLLYCFVRQSILYYDLEGNFLREIKIPFYTVRLCELSNSSKILFCEYNPNKEVVNRGTYPNLVLLKKKLKIVATDSYFDGYVDKSIVWGTHCDFSYFGDTLSIKPDHCNVVYHIYENKIIPMYFLDFGQYNITQAYWKQTKEKGISLNAMEEYDRSHHLCETMFYFESQDYICFTCRQNEQFNRFFYSKRSGRMISGTNLINDIDYYAEFVPYTMNQNIIYGIINTGEVSESKDKMKDRGRLPSALYTISEADNPVVVMYKIKKF